jgi:signal transduction histidine kinase
MGLGVLGMGPVAASTAWRLAETAYFWDDSNRATVDDVQGPMVKFQPYAGTLSQGYRKGSLWVRARVVPVDPGPARETQLLVEVQPTYLDRIELHDPTLSRSPQVTGQALPWTRDQLQALTHAFVIPAQTQPRWIYLRIQTRTTFILDLRLNDKPQMAVSLFKSELLLHALTACLLVLASFALVYACFHPTRLMAMFTLKQVMALSYGATILGYHRLMLGDWIPAPWLATGTKWIIALYAFISIWFHWEFFKPYRPKAWAIQGIRAMWALALGSVLLVAVGEVTWGLILNKWVAVILPVWLLLLIQWGIDWQSPELIDAGHILGRRFLLGVHLLMLVFLLSAALPTLGLPVAGFFTLYASILHGVITGLLLMILVHRQLFLTSQAHLRQVVSTEKNLEMERLHRERQSQFMSMLTHELRTPLSVLKLSLGKLLPEASSAQRYAWQAVEDMGNLITRCNQMDQLEQGKQVAQFARVRIGEVIREVRSKSPAYQGTVITGDGEAVVWSDLHLLQTVLLNLLDNAYKYQSVGGVVQIRITPIRWAQDPDQRIQIDVINSIDPRQMPDPDRMFQKFYRAATSQQISGTGLGLFIVKGLVTLLGAHIQAGIEPGPLMVMRLVLPTALHQLKARADPS